MLVLVRAKKSIFFYPVERSRVADCQLTAGELMPVCHPCCVFLVLGITAGWLTARHHLRLEFNRLFARQTRSFATLLQLNFFSLFFGVSVCWSHPGFSTCPERRVPTG